MDHQTDYRGSTMGSGQPVLRKIEQLRDKLKDIARLAYKVDDVLFCLSSSRDMLQEHNKTIESAEASATSHFAADSTAECINNLPGLLDTCRNQVSEADIAIQAEEAKIASGSRHMDGAIEQLTLLTADLETYVNDVCEPRVHREIVKAVQAAHETATIITSMLKSVGGNRRTAARTRTGKSGIDTYFKARDTGGLDSPVDISFDKRKTRTSGGRLASKRFTNTDLLDDSDDDEQMKIAKARSVRDAAQGSNDSGSDYWQASSSSAVNDRAAAAGPTAGSRLVAIDQKLSRLTRYQDAPSPTSQDEDMVIRSTVRATRKIHLSQEETAMLLNVQEMCSPNTRSLAIDPEVVCLEDEDSHDLSPQSPQRWEAQTNMAQRSDSARGHFSSCMQRQEQDALDSPSSSAATYSSEFELESSDAEMSDIESESELSSSAKKRKPPEDKQKQQKSKKSRISEWSRKSKLADKEMLAGSDPIFSVYQSTEKTVDRSKMKSPSTTAPTTEPMAVVHSAEALAVDETPSLKQPRLAHLLNRASGDRTPTPALHSDAKSSARSRGTSSVGMTSPEYAHKYPAPEPVPVPEPVSEPMVVAASATEGHGGSGTQSDDGQSSEGEDQPRVAPTKQPVSWPQKALGNFDQYKYDFDGVVGGLSAGKRARDSGEMSGPFSRKLQSGDGEMSQLKLNVSQKQGMDIVDLT